MNNADVCRGVWRIKDLFWHLIVRSGGDKFTTLEPFIPSGFSGLFRVFAYWEELEKEKKAWFPVSLQSMSSERRSFFTPLAMDAKNTPMHVRQRLTALLSLKDL